MRAYVANVEFAALVVGFAVIWAATRSASSGLAAQMAPGQFDVRDEESEPVDVLEVEKIMDEVE